MTKVIKKRRLSIIILCVFMFASFILIARAANSGSVFNKQISVSQTGDGSATIDGTANSVNCSVTGASIALGTGNKTLTLTLTNNSGAAATLSFDYSIESSSSSITVSEAISYSGTSGASDSYSKSNWGANETLTIKLTAPKRTTGKINISNIKLTIPQDESNITFVPYPDLGTITVAGNAVTSESTIGIGKDTGAVLTAAPKNTSTTQFLGWVDGEGKMFSTEPSLTLYPETDMTLRPVFASSSNAWFRVNGLYWFDDLNAAASMSGAELVVPMHSGTLVAGEYTIPATVNLLIPYDAACTANFNTEPGLVNYHKDGGEYVSPTMFRCLTLADGVTINCYGKINVNTRIYLKTQNRINQLYGAYGAIDMKSGSTINMKNGSVMYAYGFVGGSGTIVAESGSEIYEIMQVSDWRGGTVTSGIMGDSGLKGNSFLFSQYYLQNIEACLQIKSGSTLYGIFSVTANALLDYVEAQVPAAIVGTGEGLFRMSTAESNKNDYISIMYNANTDRMELDLQGAVTTKSMDISVSAAFGAVKYDLNTADYICPIPMNFSITVLPGSTVSFSERIKLMPGTEVVVNKGAKVLLENTGALYLYDKDDWTTGKYSNGGQIVQLLYVFARKGAPVTRTVNADSVLQIDGEAVASGPVYSTKHSENGGNAGITGSGTLVFNEGIFDTITHLKECNNNNKDSIVTIACVPAVGKLYDKQAVDSFGINTYYGFNDSNGTNYWYNVYTQMVLGSSLDMRLAFPKALFSGTPTASVADKKIALGTDTIGKAEYYFFTIQDIAAAEMGKEFKITVSDGGTQVGQHTESIQSYAMRMLGNTEYLEKYPTAKTMFVDMLNYGAAADEYFNGVANSPINDGVAGLTGTTDQILAGTVGALPENAVPAALRLGSTIELLFKFEGVTDAAYARVEFNSHWGENYGQIYRVDNLTMDNDAIVVAVDRLLVADASQPVTVQLYDKDGGVLKTVTGSIQDYLQRIYSTEEDGSALKNLCVEIMRFSKSTYDFLHARYPQPNTGESAG